MSRRRSVLWAGQRVLLALALVLLALLAPTAFTGPASAESSSRINEFVLGPGDFRPGPITLGPDGNMWFANSYGIPGQPSHQQEYKGQINRITVDGQITEFAVPDPFVRDIAIGSEGSIWFIDSRRIGRLSRTGELTELPVKEGDAPEAIVAAPSGNLWVAVRRFSSFGSDLVSRIAPNGEVTEFPLPDPESGPADITVGTDGNLWFTERFGGRIGRITPSGELTEFPLPGEHTRPISITTGPDESLWFTERFGNGIGRTTPDGEITEFQLPEGWPNSPDAILAGPDGRLWFTQGQGTIGRMTTDGHLTYIKLPNSRSDPLSLALGPEGHVWYTAWGEGPCGGGGLTCMLHVPEEPGIVGKIEPGPLAAWIRGRRALAPRRWARLRIACTDGDAGDVCQGRARLSVEISQRGRHRRRSTTVILAQRRYYAVPADTAKTVAVRLTRPGLWLLRRHRRLRVDATVTQWGGQGTSRKMVLRRNVGAHH